MPPKRSAVKPTTLDDVCAAVGATPARSMDVQVGHKAAASLERITFRPVRGRCVEA